MRLKLNLNDFRRKCQFPLLMATGTLPLAIIIMVALAPESLNLLWIFPIVYIPLALASLVIAGKRRLIAGAIGCVIQLALGLWLLPVSAENVLMAIPLLYVVLLLAGLHIGSWSKDDEIHFVWYIIGVLCHGAGQIGVNIASGGKMYPAYLTVAPVLTVSFLAFAALSLLSLNRSTLSDAAMGRQRIPAMMRHRNTLLTLGLLLLSVVIALLPAVINAIYTAGDWLWRTCVWLFMALANLISSTDSPTGGSESGDMDMSELGGEITEPSLFSQIMEKVVYVVVIVVVIVLAILAIRFLYKKLRILLRYLWKLLGRYAATASEDFEDEITDTREGGVQERVDILGTLRKRLVRVDEKKLSPVERIRYRYQRLMAKHPEWRVSQTARDTLPDQTAQLYERARYSGQEISAQEAEDFADHTKSL